MNPEDHTRTKPARSPGDAELELLPAPRKDALGGKMPRDAAECRAMVKDFKSSGLTGVEYARKIGIKYSTFCSRTHRFRLTEQRFPARQRSTTSSPDGEACSPASTTSSPAGTPPPGSNAPRPAFQEVRLVDGVARRPGVATKSAILPRITPPCGTTIECGTIEDLIRLAIALKGAR